MGGARLANGTVMSLDLSQVSSAEGVRVDGILGGDFYRRYVIVIDYQRQTVRVLDPSYEFSGMASLFRLLSKVITCSPPRLCVRHPEITSKAGSWSTPGFV